MNIEELARMSDPLELKLCKGRVYRYRENAYIDKNGVYVFQQKMVPMKRLSCPGCECCGWQEEELYNEITGDGPVSLDGCKEGALYSLVVTNVSRDWETGHVDSWDMVFVPFEDRK